MNVVASDAITLLLSLLLLLLLLLLHHHHFHPLLPIFLFPLPSFFSSSTTSSFLQCWQLATPVGQLFYWMQRTDTVSMRCVLVERSHVSTGYRNRTQLPLSNRRGKKGYHGNSLDTQ